MINFIHLFSNISIHIIETAKNGFNAHVHKIHRLNQVHYLSINSSAVFLCLCIVLFISLSKFYNRVGVHFFNESEKRDKYINNTDGETERLCFLVVRWEKENEK